MRKVTKLLLVAAGIVSLAACQKELSVKNDFAPQNSIALRSVNGMTKSAIDGTTFPTGYDMLVSAYRNLDAAVAGGDAAGNFFEGIHFSESSSAWKPITPKYWPLTGKLDFLCVATAGLKDPAKGIVPTCVWGDGAGAGNAASKVVLTVPDNSVMFDDILFGGVNDQTYVAAGNPVVFRHAEAAVVFTAKSNIAYDATNNVGITIDSIAVNGAKYSGTLTVVNPAAGAAAAKDSIAATWSDLSDAKEYVKARVWNNSGAGIDPAEAALTALHLTAESADLATKPFGEGYVILPEQEAAPFTVYYTIHNGFEADSTTKLNNNLQYKYTPEDGALWEQGRKYVYDIDINLSEISIAPSVLNWVEMEANNVEIKQYEVNALYSVNAKAGQVEALPTMIMSEGMRAKVDWGDGTIDVFTNEEPKTKAASEDATVRPAHTYTKDFEGDVRIYVMEGSFEPKVIGAGDVKRFRAAGSATINIPEPVKALQFFADGEQTLGLDQREELTHWGPEIRDSINFNYEYSYDGIEWEEWDLSQQPEIPFGTASNPVLFLRGDNPNGINYYANSWSKAYIFKFSTDAKVRCKGNVMHLLDHTQDLTVIPRNGCFSGLFAGAESLIEAPDFPATSLTIACYQCALQGTSIKVAPELPATELKSACYSQMFYDCKNLEKSPVLPALTLADECYNSMFTNCTSLKEITCLFTTNAYGSRYHWIEGVTSKDGVFYRNPDRQWGYIGSTGEYELSGVPEGWEIRDYPMDVE